MNIKPVLKIALAALFIHANALAAEQLDILDIRLGDPFDAAKERIAAHFDGTDVATYYLRSRPEDSLDQSGDIIFSDGVLYVADLRGEYSRTDVPFSEMLIVFFDDQSAGDPIIAISRVLGLSHYSISKEDIELGLIDKYGQPGRIRNWDIRGTDYMWAGDPQIQSALSTEPRDWNYVRNFEDRCFLRTFGSDFRPGEMNNLWRDVENNALPNGFFFSSQEVHRFGDLKRAIERAGYRYVEGDERFTETERVYLQEKSERRKCGEVLYANIDLWRLGGAGQRAFFFLYDQGRILDIFGQWSREVEDSGTVSSPIEF